MSKPQDVHFGNQPPKNAEVQFGKQPETEETNVTVEGDNDPTVVGVVPVFAGGDEVPDTASGGDEGVSEDTEPPTEGEDTSDGENAPENADQA